MESFATDRRATCSLRGRGVQGRVRAFGATPVTRNRWRLNRSCPYNGVSKPTFPKTVPHWQNQTISTRSARRNWKRRKSRKKSASASWIARPNQSPMRTPRRPSPAKRHHPLEPLLRRGGKGYRRRRRQIYPAAAPAISSSVRASAADSAARIARWFCRVR